MDKYFRTESGKKVDIIDYAVEQLKIDPNVKIHIGCDSQVYGSYIYYAVAIVFRKIGKGGHYIFKKIKKERPPKSVDKLEQVQLRLTEEVFMTMELVQFFQENSSLKIEAVEFDFNEDEIHLSNKLTNMAVGWAKGLGFKAMIKPEDLVACKAAHHICTT